ncbi:MAG: DUF1178 family protein, partial [Hyphomicrobiales bacterium]|nr:DUF1178 family protein [Hyphomicrobiales bacterium]
MIKYALVCQKGHEFESWFAGSQAFDEQAAKGLVECPFCGSKKISKALMAPSVSTSRKKEGRTQERREEAVRQLASPPEPAADGDVPPPGASGSVALLDENQLKLREAIRELHTKMTQNTVDVGEKFSEEARRMHDGEAPERPIRGQASLKQAKELWEDG